MLSSLNPIYSATGGSKTPPIRVGDGESQSSDRTKKTPEPASVRNASSLEELKAVRQLEARDREVRAHEQAHLGAAGNLALGGANFTYATGPDGKRYAIGGEVNIDISEIAGDPEATLKKADMIRRAALAPRKPSSQDLRIAGKAAAMVNQAQLKLLQQQAESGQSESGRPPVNTLDITV